MEVQEEVVEEEVAEVQEEVVEEEVEDEVEEVLGEDLDSVEEMETVHQRIPTVPSGDTADQRLAMLMVEMVPLLTLMLVSVM